MPVPSLGQEDPQENKMATHSSIIAWRIPWTEEPGRLQSNSSVQFSCSVMSDSLQPHALGPQNSQHHGPQNSKNRIGNSTSRHISKEYCNLKRYMHPKSMLGLAVHTNSQSLPKLMPFEQVMSSNHLILCHPLLLPLSVFPNISVFSNESALCIRWPKYWSFSFNISPSNEYSLLISFRMDWLDLLAVQGTLKNLLQHRSPKRFDARYWMIGAGALGRPRGMEWGWRTEEGSGWGTHVYLWRIHFDSWQN